MMSYAYGNYTIDTILPVSMTILSLHTCSIEHSSVSHTYWYMYVQTRKHSEVGYRLLLLYSYICLHIVHCARYKMCTCVR